MNDCDSFIQWVPGLSTKDHQEMPSQQNLLKWQKDREEADRAWRAEQSERDEQWKSRAALDERQWRTDERRWQKSERERDDKLRRIELAIPHPGVLMAIAAGIVAAMVK